MEGQPFNSSLKLHWADNFILFLSSTTCWYDKEIEGLDLNYGKFWVIYGNPSSARSRSGPTGLYVLNLVFHPGTQAPGRRTRWANMDWENSSII